MLILLLCLPAFAFARPPRHRNAPAIYTATAYSDKGLTASGQYVHRHVVAADPAVIPIGSRIKIKGAGRYSGEYVVADTGAKIEGRRLDLYIPSVRAAKRFGVKKVRVIVVDVGDGTAAAAKQADTVVKADVAKEVAKGAEGSAATDDDLVAKTAAAAKAAKAGAAPSSGPATATAPATAGKPAEAADIVKPKN